MGGHKRSLWQRLWQPKFNDNKPQPGLLQSALLKHLQEPSQNNALAEVLATLNHELETRQATIKTMENGSPEETECLNELQGLENERFNILSQLHGNRIYDYH